MRAISKCFACRKRPQVVACVFVPLKKFVSFFWLSSAESNKCSVELLRVVNKVVSVFGLKLLCLVVFNHCEARLK